MKDVAAPGDLPAVSEYLGAELTKSDRPELASAKVTYRVLSVFFHEMVVEITPWNGRLGLN
jgi:hypothetical protein